MEMEVEIGSKRRSKIGQVKIKKGAIDRAIYMKVCYCYNDARTPILAQLSNLSSSIGAERGES